ncbi:Hypothetical predicted protein [Podarcis lilfordi]|uniref:Uncharacterized protein n=1 Tax=Podarcis lilfordi TaxID=74358 RepID=A0AA35KIX4_9SAUR|nr:Hypothetical predicted protein [Podarcis lilfordi]
MTDIFNSSVVSAVALWQSHLCYGATAMGFIGSHFGCVGNQFANLLSLDLGNVGSLYSRSDKVSSRIAVMWTEKG